MKMPRLIHMSDFFNISSIHLLDEPVIAANGDIRMLSFLFVSFVVIGPKIHDTIKIFILLMVAHNE